MLQQFCFEFQRRRDAECRAVTHGARRQVAELAASVVNRRNDSDGLAVDGVLKNCLQMLDDLRITLPCDELQDGGRILGYGFLRLSFACLVDHLQFLLVARRRTGELGFL